MVDLLRQQLAVLADIRDRLTATSGGGTGQPVPPRGDDQAPEGGPRVVPLREPDAGAAPARKSPAKTTARRGGKGQS